MVNLLLIEHARIHEIQKRERASALRLASAHWNTAFHAGTEYHIIDTFPPGDKQKWH